MRNKLKWDLAKPLKRPDYIQSSDFQNSAPFVPSYEKNPVHDMHKLLEMEYSGKWHDERYLWDRRVFPPAERSYFCRKYVIRGPNKKYATKTPPKPFKMKRFMNIPSKTDHTRPPAKEVPRPKYVTDRENKYAPVDGVTVARSPQPVGGSPQPIIEDKCVCTPTKKRADEEPKKSSQSLRSDKSPDSTSSGKRSKTSSQGKDPGANDVANKENFDQSNEKKESRGSSKGEKSAADLAENDKRSRQSTRSHTSSVSISSLATCPGFSIKSGASSTKSREAKGEKYCPKDRPCPAKLLEEKEQASEKSLPLSNKGSVDKRVCCKRNIGMESKPGCLGRHN